MLRKIFLCSLVAALGILFVVLRPAYQVAFNKFYHVPAAATPKLPRATYYLAAAGDSAAIRAVVVAESASSAKIEAATAAGGWVPSGTVASKFIAFAGIYLLMIIWPFWVQRLTHPAPTKWQLASYSAEFEKLTVLEKIASVRAIQQNNVWRAIGAALFAALVV